MAAHNSQHTRIAQLQHCIQAMMRHEIREELDALDQHDEPPRSMQVEGYKLDSHAAAGCES